MNLYLSPPVVACKIFWLSPTGCVPRPNGMNSMSWKSRWRLVIARMARRNHPARTPRRHARARARMHLPGMAIPGRTPGPTPTQTPIPGPPPPVRAVRVVRAGSRERVGNRSGIAARSRPSLPRRPEGLSRRRTRKESAVVVAAETPAALLATTPGLLVGQVRQQLADDGVVLEFAPAHCAVDHLPGGIDDKGGRQALYLPALHGL